MGELTILPNIGKTLEPQLNEVGIETVQQLIDTGSKEVWLKIRAIDDSACINMLFALEGAVQGIRWHNLSKEVRVELKEFYNENKSAHTI